MNTWAIIGILLSFNKINVNKNIAIIVLCYLLRRGIEREIEIIGEATNRILKIEPDFVLTNARQIVDTRNWVIHAYDKVDDVVIWGIISKHLPKLKEEVENYLKEQ